MSVEQIDRPSTVSGRVAGIDFARALAGLIMIQGHAYDGWASPEGKATASYAFTRLLGSLPLPAFLLLAGAAVAWRTAAAAERGEPAARVRRRVALRGLQIVAWGYGVSVLYALMDGYAGLETLLRADVLHVIGLSIALVAWLGIRASPADPRGRAAPPALSRLLGAAGFVGVSTTLGCPWLSVAAGSVDGPLRYFVALFADVPGITLMPLVPLAAWFTLGIGAGVWLFGARADNGAGIARERLVLVALVGLVVSMAASLATRLVLEQTGVALSRHHPVVWLNVLDLGARGLFVLGVGALAANYVRGPLRRALLMLGRGSLVAYVFHIPFCYGAFARPIEGRLEMPAATAFVAALMLTSWLAVWIRDTARAALDRRRATVA